MAYSDQSARKVIGIIPARYASTRFPGKPLADIHGKSMIIRVCEQARRAEVLDEIVVATDDARIMDHVSSAGFEAVMTSPEHRSGTDRCLEALEIISRRESTFYDYLINIQGDEPLIPPENIRQVANLLLQGDIQIATLARIIQQAGEVFNPNVVKVVIGNEGKAHYFSRAPIPYLRGLEESRWASERAHYRHIGIYGFQVSILRQACSLPPGRLELLESLEQLRWLEAGFRITVGITELDSISVDTPADLSKITNTD